MHMSHLLTCCFSHHLCTPQVDTNSRNELKSFLKFCSLIIEANKVSCMGFFKVTWVWEMANVGNSFKSGDFSPHFWWLYVYYWHIVTSVSRHLHKNIVFWMICILLMWLKGVYPFSFWLKITPRVVHMCSCKKLWNLLMWRKWTLILWWRQLSKTTLTKYALVPQIIPA